MKQHQTSQDSFARSLIGLSIGIVVLLGGVMLLFQNFYINADSNPSVTTHVAEPEPLKPTLVSETETSSSNKPQTISSNSVVPPVLLSLQDKQVISANDSITMPAPAKPRATMANEVETANVSTPIESPTPANVSPPTPAEKTVASVDDAPSSKTVVESANKTTSKSSEALDEKTKKDKVALTSTQTETSKTGWIYAGQFSEGKWQAKGLIIGDELPSTGHSYALNWGANIRANPPGKAKVDGLSENVGYLAQGRKVEVVQIKQSGSKGHIWVQIKR